MLMKAIRHLSRDPALVVFPIVMDMVAWTLGWTFGGFAGTPSVSFRLLLDVGFPSVSYILNTPIMANQAQIMTIAVVPTAAWAVVIPLMLVSMYAQGGYIGSLRNVAEGTPASLKQWIHNGNAYWLQYVFVHLLIILAKTAATALFVYLFQAAGLFLAFLLFVLLRIRFIYFEFSIVVDRSDIGRALRRSWRYYRQSAWRTSGWIACFLCISGTLSFLIHHLWSPYAILAGIVVNAYCIGVVELALMMVLCEIRKNPALA